MTYELLFEAALRAAWTWPLDGSLRAPRCVLAADDPGDLTKPPPYEAYLSGLFWARDWVARGARESDMQLERPLVALERKRAVMTQPETGMLCSEVWITVLDGPCGPDRGCQVPETGEALTRRLMDTLAELVRRMASFRVGQRTSDGAMVLWHPVLDVPGPPAGVEFVNGPDGMVLDPKAELELQVTGLVDVNEGRSVSVQVIVCGCWPRPTVFVPYERPAGLGEPRCELC